MFAFSRFPLTGLVLALLVVGLVGCEPSPVNADFQAEAERLPAPTALTAAPKKSAPAADVDAFADAVVEDGVNDQGQGFPDPAGILGNLQVLDPAKTPPVTGLGVGGFAVVDMGSGEEIEDKQGFDFLIVEADGSLLGAGFGFPEPFTVSVSDVPSGPFVEISTVNGSGLFDLKGTGLKTARYVRIEDAGGVPPSGADIQSVVALNQKGADLRVTPSTIKRSAASGHITGHLDVPQGFEVAEASIVLVAALDQPAPTPPPYFSPLDIPGTLTGKGGTVQFDRAAFLDEAPDGTDLVLAVKVTSTAGEVIFLFDLATVQP